MRKFLTALGTALGLSALLAVAGGAAQSDDAAYSPKDIFTPENSVIIYSDCPNAHEAADFLGKHADTTSADEAVGAEQFFLNCFNEKRAIYNNDKDKYLVLAISAAIYIQAKGTTGERHADALKRGMALLARVLPRPAGPALSATQVVTPPPVPAGMNQLGRPAGIRTPQPTEKYVMNGARPNWKFTPQAESLESAYDALVVADKLSAARQ